MSDSVNEVQELKEAQQAFLSELDEILSAARKKYRQITAKESQIEEKSLAIEDAYNSINENLNSSQAILDASKSIKLECDKVLNEADRVKTQVKSDCVEAAEKLSVSNSTIEKLNLENESLQKKIANFQENYDKLNQLYLITFEDDESAKRKSKKAQFNEFSETIAAKSTEFTEYLEVIKKQFKDLKEELTQQIHDLLPDAGATGLAGAFYESKTRYGNVGKWPTWPTIFYYLLFLIPSISLIWCYFYVEEFKQFTPQGVLAKLTLSLPLGAIAYMGWTSISMNRRLYEEYNHKQRVMQLYHSFVEEIENLEEPEELRALLLKTLLETVKDKPSWAMKEHDRNNRMLLEKLLDTLRNKDKEEDSSKDLE
jgi:hypothetical protein